MVWNCISPTSQEMIENVQKRFFRIVYDRYIGRTVYYSYARLLERCKCPTLSFRRRERDLVFLYKCIHGLIDCPDLTSAINIHVPSRVLRVSPTFHVNHIIQTSPMTRIQHFYNTLRGANIDVFNPNFVAFKTFVTNL